MPNVISDIVGVCVFRFMQNSPEYLLLQRGMSDELYPSIWQIVTGTLNNGETAVKAALRELEEETGLAPVHFWLVPHIAQFYDPDHDRVHQIPFFAAQVEAGSDPSLSAEHQRFQWLSAQEACARLVWPGQRSALEVVHTHIVTGTESARLSRMDISA